MYFSRAIRFGLISAGVGAFIAATARPAEAQLTVTLNQPFQFYNTSSGDQVLLFVGTIQNNTRDAQTISTTAISFPFTSTGQPLSNKNGSATVLGAAPTPVPTMFAPGDSFSGTLFVARLDNTTKTGLYNMSVGAGTVADVPSVFEVQESDTVTGQFFNVTTRYSINVNPPVPEASTAVGLGFLLALGGLAAAVKRKRAAETNSASA